MLIRKQYRVEMGHIVRNCSSDRCAHSMHGHSAIIEVLLEGSALDNAGMLYDFGLMKGTVKQFIDAFDHCYVFWDKDDPEYIESIKKFCDRWISLPFNPTAEMLSLMYMNAINRIIRNTTMLNGEATDLHCCGVIYHETESGYAKCCEADNATMWNGDNLDNIKFSPKLMKEMKEDLIDTMRNRMVNQKLKPFKQVEADPCGFYPLHLGI